MGMIPSAAAQEAAQEKAKNEVSGPGAYTYPSHRHVHQRSEVCQKPFDDAQYAPHDNIVCGNMFEELLAQGPGRPLSWTRNKRENVNVKRADL